MRPQEIDHKDGHNSTGKFETDFQWVRKHTNDAKRTHCIRCKDTKIRFDARNLKFKIGWIEGNDEYTSTLGCKGCYWNDIAKFHTEISAGFTSSID